MKRLVFCMALCFPIFAFGAYSNITLNITSAGGRLTGANFTSIGSLSPFGGQDMWNGTLYNHSGFAAGFILQPETAHSGLPDEWNPDDDQDGLQDVEEIAAGSNLNKADTDNDGLDDYDEVKVYGSSPVLSDSDADSMPDFDEVTAGTSPTNRSSFLSVTCVHLPNNQKKVTWFGVVGRVYTLQYCTDLVGDDWDSNPFEILGSGSVISFMDAPSASNRFYRVKVRIDE